MFHPRDNRLERHLCSHSDVLKFRLAVGEVWYDLQFSVGLDESVVGRVVVEFDGAGEAVMGASVFFGGGGHGGEH